MFWTSIFAIFGHFLFNYMSQVWWKRDMDEIKPVTYIGRHFSLISPSFEAKKMFKQYIISVFEVYLVLFSLFKMRSGQNICF